MSERKSWPVACHWCGVSCTARLKVKPGPAYKHECDACRESQRPCYGDDGSAKQQMRAGVRNAGGAQYQKWLRLMGYDGAESTAEMGTSGDD